MLGFSLSLSLFLSFFLPSLAEVGAKGPQKEMKICLGFHYDRLGLIMIINFGVFNIIERYLLDKYIYTIISILIILLYDEITNYS